MSYRILFTKYSFATLLFMAQALIAFCQKEIIKNGVKINLLDKQKKKQGQWFFFDKKGDIILSCNYQDDSIISPLTFYRDNDTALIRYPEVNSRETFILYSGNEQIAGNYKHIDKDSMEVEIIGRYRQISKDSFTIDEDTELLNSSQKKQEARSWYKKKIAPVYMFGNVLLRDYLYGQFHSSDFIFNKIIYAVIFINESGLVEKIELPRDINTLSFYEEAEVLHIFSGMQRWQPYFYGIKTIRAEIPFTWSSTISD